MAKIALLLGVFALSGCSGITFKSDGLEPGDGGADVGISLHTDGGSPVNGGSSGSGEAGSSAGGSHSTAGVTSNGGDAGAGGETVAAGSGGMPAGGTAGVSGGSGGVSGGSGGVATGGTSGAGGSSGAGNTAGGGSGGSGGSGPDPECTPTDSECHGDTPWTCNSEGFWEVGSACPFVCSQGACTGVCEPTTTDCSDTIPRTCNSLGAWVEGSACPFVCSAGSCIGVCIPNDTKCTGDDVETCDSNGQWQYDSTCPYACSNGSCSGECDPGTVECGGAGTKTCGTDSFWETPVACPSTASAGYPTSYHLVPSCSAGVCGFDCGEGWDNCHGNDVSCETLLATDSNDCGVCGHDCGGSSCANNLCNPFPIARPYYENLGGNIISAPTVKGLNIYYGERRTVSAVSTYYLTKWTLVGGTSTAGTASIEANLTGPAYYVNAGSELCWTRRDDPNNGYGSLFCNGQQRLSNQYLLGHVWWRTFFGTDKITSYGTVASQAGGAVTTFFAPTANEGLVAPNFLTSTHVYWVTAGNGNYKISRQTLVGGSPETLVTGQKNLMSIWVEGTKVLWTTSHSYSPDTPARVWELDMSTGITSMVYENTDAFGLNFSMITSDGTNVFWVAADLGYEYQILRTPLAGGPVIPLTNMLDSPHGWLQPQNTDRDTLVTDANYIYWTSDIGSGSDLNNYVFRLAKSHWTDF